jgi:hypothetical protein
MKYFFLFLILILATTQAYSQDNPKRDQCGDFRWDVKTLTDSKVGDVDFGKSVQTTVAEQVKLKAPARLGITTPRFATEDKVFTLTAKLIKYKEESKKKGDHDFHIVLGDANSSATMVAEIPSSASCATPKSSAHRAEFDAARKTFLDLLNKNGLPAPTGTLTAVPKSKHLFVTVKGVGMWDIAGGHASGSALNGREIHPVLEIK